MFWRLFLTYGGSMAVAVTLTALLIRNRAQSEILWIAGPIILLALLPAWYFAHRFVRPIQELTEGVRRIARGDYGQRVHLSGPEELQTLARTFTELSHDLARQFELLQHDRQQLRAILSGMIEGVVALDASECVLFANERAGQLLEFDHRSAMGRKFYEVVRQRPLQEMLARVRHASEPVLRELDWVGPEVRHLAIYASRIPVERKEGSLLVLNDITELRRLERIRQDFVANVSHELKTPLAVINASVEALLDGAAEDVEARPSFLNQIAQQGQRLHDLINDLLSLARIESGHLEIEMEAVVLADVIADCIEQYRPRAESRSQSLAIESEDDRVRVLADEHLLMQILDNLIENAIKYTQEGGAIRIGWSATPSQVAIRVTDNGIGIPSRDLPRIFERFYCVDKGRSRAVGGTGLGLSIVKHLAQSLNGSIDAESRLGQGSTFTLTLGRAPDE